MHKSLLIVFVVLLNFSISANASQLSYVEGNGKSIEQLIIDPKNSNIIYGVMAEPILFGQTSGQVAVYDYFPNQVYKSTDAGITWSLIKETSNIEHLNSLDFFADDYVETFLSLVEETEPENIFSIAMNPQDTNELYITTNVGTNFFPNIGQKKMYRTNDGGQTWIDTNLEFENSPRSIDLLIDYNNPDNLILYTWSIVYYSSIDHGLNWQRNEIDFIPGVYINILNMYFDPQTPSTIYVVSSDPRSFLPIFSGIIKSTDSGQSWREISRDYGIYDYDPNPDIEGEIGVHEDVVLAINPHNPQIIYSGFPSAGLVKKSIDGGTNWVEIINGLDNPFTEVIAIDPHNPEVVYLGTKTGLYRSTNSGDLWSLIPGTSLLHIRSLAIDPQNPENIFVGTLGKGLYRLITDSNCHANFDTVSGKATIPCLKIDHGSPVYTVTLQKDPVSLLFDVLGAELR